MSFANYIYFLTFCIIMVFSPGPMVMLLMNIGVERGTKRTLPAQLGASTAYFISLVIFAVGLTSLLQTHGVILKIIQIIGVSYVLYLAYKQWKIAHLEPKNIENHKLNMNVSTFQLYNRGLITGLSNPKTIVMFSAVIPQFTNNPAPRVIDVTILSLTFLLLQFASGVTYSIFGQYVSSLLTNKIYHKRLYLTMSFLLFLVAIMIAIK